MWHRYRAYNRGSPPHTWGKDHVICLFYRPDRITPAHAGKSLHSVNGITLVRDHPRTRGEKAAIAVAMSTQGGSPPHTRGKGNLALKSLLYIRITPAHAGKSFFPDVWTFFSEDHPRTRGEKPFWYSGDSNRLGSPPHTRGKVSSASARSISHGITPAHAGKRFALLS